MKEISLRIDTHLVFDLDELEPEATKALCEAYTRSNPEFYKKKRMGFWLKNISSTIKSWKILGDKFLSLPRGTKNKAFTILKKFDIKIGKIVDKTITSEKVGLSIRKEETLRPDQIFAVNFLVKEKNAIIRGDCGSGKTVILLGAIAKIDQTAIVIVHSNSLLKQWQDAVIRWLGIKPGILGDGKKKLGSITIATQQTIWNMFKSGNTAWAKNFAVLVADEAQKWSSKTYNIVAESFPATWRICASADERRKDQKEFLLYETFGTSVYKIKKTELIQKGQLLPIEMKIVPTNYRDEIYLESVRTGLFCFACDGNLTSTKQERINGLKHCIKCGLVVKPETLDWVGMINNLVNDEERNSLILRCIIDVLEQDPEFTILVLSERVMTCRCWAAKLDLLGVPTGLLLGSPKNKKELSRSISNLQNLKIRVGFGTSVADEGLDIPALTHVFITCPVHTHPKRLRQMIGRSARPFGKKKFGKAVYFWDREMFPPLVRGIKYAKHELQSQNLLMRLKKVADRFSFWNFLIIACFVILGRCSTEHPFLIIY